MSIILCTENDNISKNYRHEIKSQKNCKMSLKDKFTELCEKIEKTKTYDKTIDYLNLVQKVCGALNVPKEKFVGNDISVTLSVLCKVARERHPGDVIFNKCRKVHQSKLKITSDLLVEMEQWCINYKEYCGIQNTKVEIMKYVIEQKKELIIRKQKDYKEEIEAINDEVAKLHDIKNTEDVRVYKLYSDGEIMTTKGGVLYGLRSLFTHQPSACIPIFSFPKQVNDVTCAILKKEDAENIREKMLKFQC